MRLALLLCALLVGCGVPMGPTPRTIAEKERRLAPVLERHPECAEATGTAPTVNAGCSEHCAPRVLGRVCTDQGEVFYVPSREPLHAPYGRVLRESGCWEILELDPLVKRYTGLQFTWAAHPPDGAPCVRDRYPQDWGWFDRHHGLLNFHDAWQAQIAE